MEKHVDRVIKKNLLNTLFNIKKQQQQLKIKKRITKSIASIPKPHYNLFLFLQVEKMSPSFFNQLIGCVSTI